MLVTYTADVVQNTNSADVESWVSLQHVGNSDLLLFQTWAFEYE